MKPLLTITAMCLLLPGAPCLRARAQQPADSGSEHAAMQPVVLDKVEALIHGDVLLQSDVNQEMRFAVLEPVRILPGQNTAQRALRRLIDRSLILDQMKDQQQPTATDSAKVAKALDDLKKQLPECPKYHCETEAGWKAFLAAHGLMEQEVSDRWSERLAILHFIDVRFRTGIRISNEQVEDYYRKTLLPALQKAGQPAPALNAVAPRIQEVLLQQEVSSLLQDWLKSLRDEGNVQIVDPAYAAAGSSSDGDDN
ncbi:peptidylprolyl isomerase [Paracidobacterium acidisoli]|uniref:Peptidylprolyl isomerase n=1 Tax=Paracidobacterium acidisoli TaxID=2303751 RepID=A0A372IVH2_9BACT|nr:peptidylprolyl isomerase [Paracidobacterium acidisoli]MBT9329840.1 peptidylprolyl isomerase [Paracidobacterium acidisoli]